ncbi:lymphocyte antigen 6F isoform X2 [Exaiptasia diaphana]|uniref:UPAR/Ly6 domain-containing protein n=1 Tax=Exaiptasia diaphana TaxID=2652724 RepID=A0A913Y418_EXADI|nr:lymphocyte antigen 6F isoform X2 [Exaiptasia diaphana]
MKTIISIVLCILTVIHVASSLTCYKCESTISYADCESRQEQVACDKDEDTCIKGDISYQLHSQDHKSFRKYCAVSSKCDKEQNPQCKTAALGENIECNIHCCSLNLCNAGSSVIVSGVVMVAAFIVMALF